MSYKLKKILTKKRVVWASVIVILLAVIVGGISLKSSKKKNGLNLAEVKRGKLEQTVSETGTVKKSDEISLSFKAGGVIDAIYVELGEHVKQGQLLAKTDYSALSAQYQKADAFLKSSQAQLAQLLAGATTEEINLAKTQVENAKNKLKNKKKSLENTELSAENDLNDAYQDALTELNSVYLYLQGAYLAVDDIYQTYFNSNNQEGSAVKKAREDIKEAKNNTKAYIDLVLANNTQENIDMALSQVRQDLDLSYTALSDAREACETTLYRTTVTDADKTKLDTQKSNINAERIKIVNAEQLIASTKVNNTLAIDTAKAQVADYQGLLDEAERNLEKLVAGPTKEEIDVYEAKVAQAQADKSVLSSQISQARLSSPVAGQVVRVEKRVGETAIAGETVISLLPEKPFQIKTNIYEEDVAKLAVGNKVKIQLIAFPDLEITGIVSSINPIDKIIDGVVYYETLIDFNEKVKGLRPGMSADITIQTNSKDNVLFVPEAAISQENGKLYVQVLEKDKKIKKEVKTGMKGDDGLIEVTKGLKEGEKIILP